MIQRFFTSIIVYCLLASSALAEAPQGQSLEKLDNLIASNQLSVALPIIEKDLTKSPNDLELLMRKARIVTLQGDQTSNEKNKIKSYESAKAIGDQMVKIDSKSPKGYLRRAIAKGKLILFKGVLESRSLVLELRSDAKKALKLKSASSYEKALASYLLGRAHLKLADKPRAIRIPLGLGWANKSKGGDFLKEAFELSPNSIPFNLDYAIWLNENGDKTKAKKILTKIATLDVYDPADPEHKATAKKLLGE